MDKQNLKILYSNVDYLINKMNDIKLTIFENEDNKPDIIMLTEINAKNTKYRLSENDYNLYSKNTDINNCHRIVVYVNDKLNVIKCTNIETEFDEQIL